MSRLLVSALLAVGLNVAASEPASSGEASDSQQQVVQAGQTLLDKYQQELFSRHFAEALATVDKVNLKDLPGPEERAVVQAMRAAALMGLKRNGQADKLVAEVRATKARDPFATNMLFLGGLLTHRYDVAAGALDDFIARYPDILREQDRSYVYLTLRKAPDDQRNDDRRINLARIGFGGDKGDWLDSEAAGILLKRGDVDGAAELLKDIDEPTVVEDMLIQRRYAALWPRLEELAGPHLERIRSRSVAAAERAYELAPDDHEKLADLANALRQAGRLDDAIALRSKIPATSAAMAQADEQIGWLVNAVGYALHRSGRSDEADRLFALLNDAPMTAESWRVSMKINRLELLVSDGKFARALPLIEPTANSEGTEYAAQLVRRLRYCTLSGLGRKDEAAKYLADLLAHAEDAPGPTVDALLCAGNIDEAERVALAMLKKKESFAGDFVRQMQQHLLTSDDPSIWQGRWSELRKRPSMQGEFNKLGRDMPISLLPEPVKAPRLSSGD
jgi:tetratricopeptide (TPR) repeat protein